MSVPEPVWRADGELLDVLHTLGCELERVEAGAYLVTLHGRRRGRTLVWLIAGEQAVAVEAFVMHVVPAGCPDPAALHRHLLGRSLRMRDVHFALDDVGDVFLTGSLAAVTVESVDRVLGEVLQVLEDEQEALLRLAYGTRLTAAGPGGDPADEALRAKVLADGAGRRPAGTPDWSPRRDPRR